jgi:SagB-type dehydrogenase family enzyme
MMSDPVGDRFQQETKYAPDRMTGGPLDWANQPDTYKVYTDAPRVELPAPSGSPAPASAAKLDDVLRTRHSVRDFAPEPISLDQLGYLLWASTGVQRRERGHAFRTAPSAGALYPVETYLAANRADGVEPGLYHYAIREHALERLAAGDHGVAVAQGALGQRMCADAAATFIWSGVFPRSKWKYKQRAYRYVYLDAGHVAANLALAAVALGLGSCQIAALFDDEMNRLLDLDGADESVIYMSAVGVPG